MRSCVYPLGGSRQCPLPPARPPALPQASCTNGLLDDLLGHLLAARAALLSKIDSADAPPEEDDYDGAGVPAADKAAGKAAPISPAARRKALEGLLRVVGDHWAVLSRRAHLLRHFPEETFQTLANGLLGLAAGLDESALAAAGGGYEAATLAAAAGRAWLLRANFRYGGQDACRSVLDNHTAGALGCAFTPSTEAAGSGSGGAAGGAAGPAAPALPPLLLTVSADGSVKLIDAETGALKRTLPGHAPAQATCCALRCGVFFLGVGVGGGFGGLSV